MLVRTPHIRWHLNPFVLLANRAVFVIEPATNRDVVKPDESHGEVHFDRLQRQAAFA